MDDDKKGEKPDINLGGFLGGLGEILSRLDKMLEEGGEGERDLRDSKGNVIGRAGWSVRSGMRSSMPPRGGSAPSNYQPRSVSKPPPQPSYREPLAEVFDEVDELLVIVELPGVALAEVDLALKDTHLLLRTTGSRQYGIDIALPRQAVEIRSKSINNGILEIHLA